MKRVRTADLTFYEKKIIIITKAHSNRLVINSNNIFDVCSHKLTVDFLRNDCRLQFVFKTYQFKIALQTKHKNKSLRCQSYCDQTYEYLPFTACVHFM